MLRKTLSGVGTALITPFKKDESVDFEALGNLIDIQIAAGINYVVTLGTTGESVTLSEKANKDFEEYLSAYRQFQEAKKKYDLIKGRFANTDGGKEMKKILNLWFWNIW